MSARTSRSALALAVLLLAATSPTLADPLNLGPLSLLPGDDIPGPAAASQIGPSVARGGNQYLSAWQDDRGGSWDVYASRLDANGNPLDVPPLALTQAAGWQGSPRVAWNGTNWLVAWPAQIATQFYWAYGVQAVRISPTGQVLDPTPITVIAYQNSSNVLFGLASDGTNWAVAVEGTSAGEAAIRGVRIAPDGTVLDPGGVVVVPETYYLRFGIDLGGVPGEYLLVWNEWRTSSDDVLAYRLTPSLGTVEGHPFVVAARTLYETNARVASNGTDFFVGWDLNDNYLFSEVYGTRVTFAGQVLEPNGKALSNSGFGYGRDPSVAWDGVNWIASWPNYGGPGLNVGRMDTQGTILDPGGVSMPALGWGSIAGNASGGVMAVWSDATGGSDDVFGAPISGSLVPGNPTCASLGAPAQTALALAHNGSGYLAVFLSARSAGSRVLSQRLDADGAPVDAQPFEIAGPTGNYASPAVAWNGSLYMVTWVSGSQIFERRVAANGTPLDPAPVFVMNGRESNVAAVGDVFLVVGNFAPQNPEFVFVFGTRVRGADGAKLDVTPINVGGSFSLHPKVARLGARWLCVWEQHPTHDDPHAAVVGNFIDANGAASGAFTVSVGSSYSLAPALAANPDTALVAWSDSRPGSNNLDIYGRRVLAGGTMLDPAGLAMSTVPASNQTLPAVGWDGSEFISLFQDPRNIPVFFDEHLDVYGTRVTTGGVVSDPTGFALAADPGVMEMQPAVAGAAGRAALGCAVYVPSGPYGAFRIGLRRLNPAAVGVLVGTPTVPLHLAAAPNPFRPSTELTFELERPGRAKLAVFDVAGRLVATLADESFAAGRHRVAWHGVTDAGGPAPAGVYYVKSWIEGRTETARLVRIR